MYTGRLSAQRGNTLRYTGWYTRMVHREAYPHGTQGGIPAWYTGRHTRKGYPPGRYTREDTYQGGIPRVYTLYMPPYHTQGVYTPSYMPPYYTTLGTPPYIHRPRCNRRTVRVVAQCGTTRSWALRKRNSWVGGGEASRDR